MKKEQLSNIVSKLEYVHYLDIKTPDILTHESFFRKMIENRIKHCEENLKENLHHAVKAMHGQMILWENGHFSLPVYNALIESRKLHVYDWSALIWEQIIRQMAREKNIDPLMFDIASEGCLCGPYCE